MSDQEIKVKFSADNKELSKALKENSTGLSNIAQEAKNASSAASGVLGKLKIFGLNLDQLTKGIKGIAADASAATFVISKGFEAAKEVIKGLFEYFSSSVVSLREAAVASADDLKRVYEEHEKERQSTHAMAKELDSLNNTLEKTETQKQRMIELVNRLSSAYGGLKLSIDPISGAVRDMDGAMMKLLEKQKAQRIGEIEARMSELQNVINISKKEVESEGRWYNLIRNKGDSKVVAAQEEGKKAAAELLSLQKQLSEAKKSDDAGEYRRQKDAEQRERVAKDMAEAKKKREEAAQKAAQKEAEEAQKAAEEAEKALEEREKALKKSREDELLAGMTDQEKARYSMEKELAADRKNGMSAEELEAKRARLTAEFVSKFQGAPLLKKIDEVKTAIENADKAARDAVTQAEARAKEAKQKAKDARKEARGKRVLKKGYTRDEEGTYRNAKGRRVGKRTATRWVPATPEAKRKARKAEKEEKAERRKEAQAKRAEKRAAADERRKLAELEARKKQTATLAGKRGQPSVKDYLSAVREAKAARKRYEAVLKNMEDWQHGGAPEAVTSTDLESIRRNANALLSKRNKAKKQMDAAEAKVSRLQSMKSGPVADYLKRQATFRNLSKQQEREKELGAAQRDLAAAKSQYELMRNWEEGMKRRGKYIDPKNPHHKRQLRKLEEASSWLSSAALRVKKLQGLDETDVLTEEFDANRSIDNVKKKRNVSPGAFAPGIKTVPGMKTVPGISSHLTQSLGGSLATPLNQIVQNTAGLGRRIYVVR